MPALRPCPRGSPVWQVPRQAATACTATAPRKRARPGCSTRRARGWVRASRQPPGQRGRPPCGRVCVCVCVCVLGVGGGAGRGWLVGGRKRGRGMEFAAYACACARLWVGGVGVEGLGVEGHALVRWCWCWFATAHPTRLSEAPMAIAAAGAWVLGPAWVAACARGPTSHRVCSIRIQIPRQSLFESCSNSVEAR